MRANIYARLERLRERVGLPEEPGNGEAREKARRALETIHGLILEHGDEKDRDYKERIGRGEGHLTALIAAKQGAIDATAGGREALAVADAIRGAGGRGDT